MDLLHPRAAYHRANSDDPNAYDDGVELSSLYSKNSQSQTEYLPDWRTGSAQHLVPETNQYSGVSGVQYKKAKRFSGWRFGAICAALTAALSLTINIVAIIWLSGHHNTSSGLVEIFTGDCEEVRQMSLWVHLAINVLSTLLLSGSNYCMQCLSSPTRDEVDKAHEKGKYLDIGVPSARNLRSIARHRMFLWWILGLSSLPLHFLYNSAFYGSLSTNDYDIFVSTPGFVEGANFTTTPSNISSGADTADVVKVPSGSGGDYYRIETLDCIKAYAQTILSDRRNIILVSSNATAVANDSVRFLEGYTFHRAVSLSVQSYEPFNWICVSDPRIGDKIDVPTSASSITPCDTYVSKIEAIYTQWTPYNYSIDYCLSEQIPETCSFNGNIPIVAIVITSNSIKILVMLFVALCLSGQPLMTIGDAVESFLRCIDPSTIGRCWMTRGNVTNFESLSEGNESKLWPVGKSETKYHPSTISLDGTRWSHAASRKRWTFTMGLVITALIVSLALLVMSVQAVGMYNGSIWSLGVGQVHATSIISGWSIDDIPNPATQILASILIANLPQAILSFLYLNLNGLLTSMWVEAEWSDFATERKHLRVSNPKGDQRSTYFLQLPYKIAFPLMATSGLLHWLVSQSVFLAVVAEYTSSGELFNAVQVASCGFSPIAILLTIALGIFIIVVTTLIGRRRYRRGMPMAGSCSAAISAACHRPDWDSHASLCAVKYGQIPGVRDIGGVGHCSFSSGDVEPVWRDRLYAGMSVVKLD